MQVPARAISKRHQRLQGYLIGYDMTSEVNGGFLKKISNIIRYFSEINMPYHHIYHLELSSGPCIEIRWNSWFTLISDFIGKSGWGSTPPYPTCHRRRLAWLMAQTGARESDGSSGRAVNFWHMSHVFRSLVRYHVDHVAICSKVCPVEIIPGNLWTERFEDLFGLVDDTIAMVKPCLQVLM